MKKLFFLTKSKLSTKSTTWRLLVVFAFLLGWVILLSATPNIALGVAAALRTTFLVIGNVLVTILGWGISLVLPVLVNVAQFNDFVNNPAVVNGWKLMRDICNMFFIVIMLIISVGTVLNIQGYTYKNYLKKILLAAVLINFSKTISGLLIDISQIIMLTFVSAFKDSLAVGITQAFHLNQFSQLTQSTDPVTGEVSSGVMESIFASVLVTVMAAIILCCINRHGCDVCYSDCDVVDIGGYVAVCLFGLGVAGEPVFPVGYVVETIYSAAISWSGHGFFLVANPLSNFRYQ
jgi:hypothetical protein